MDSSQPHPSKPSASKLPIKRKAPHHPQFFTPKLEYQPIILPPPKPKPKPQPQTPPFKFQRIWSEPDEIRFLQALLRSHHLSFPKDLPLFYSSFSHSMSQPYTKSQLSEKLRRLRKKFRVVSSRLARGLNPSSLSLHDRALFDLSKRLWSPEFASSSPFGKNSSGFNGVAGNGFDDCDTIDDDGEVKINGVSLHYDFAAGRDEVISGEAIDGVLEKSVLNAFDECFKEVRVMFMKQGVVCMDTTERKWKEQRVSEFDVLGRRLRLVIENSLTRR
ncbi:hypothetical protein Goshw_023230 [Gossypium schwendimanii]|uniref:Glabrous enhancer-binding protein-like DBD domain-containing protein n=1 Tax=Gossypium schwendimanii TaxID=34291 RepID=A0A7J9LZF5_GOSSC|nr:hypothetical protein [Gossypium schwendimanii]